MSNVEIIEKTYAEAVSGIKEEWFYAIDTKWYNYVTDLPIHLEVTYLVVVLHNQVLNGGFHQYFINGYGQFAKETVEALKLIGAPQKANLLNDALKIVNEDNYSDEIFRRLLITKKITQLFSEGVSVESLDQLDSAYYMDENEDIEKLLGEYLRK